MQNSRSDNEPFDVLSQAIPRLVMFGVKTWAAAIEVVIRKDFGEEYLGTQAAAVVLFIPAYIVMTPEYSPLPMLGYLGLYLVLCGVHRFSVIRRNWRGEYGHRYYNGVPRLWRNCPKLSEVTVKKWVEPFFVVGAGIVLMPVAPPLGLFLIVGAFCSVCLMLDWDIRTRKRAREMHDAMIEQEAVAERFRELRGERDL